jgi:hypothetical protein
MHRESDERWQENRAISVIIQVASSAPVHSPPAPYPRVLDTRLRSSWRRHRWSSPRFMGVLVFPSGDNLVAADEDNTLEPVEL